MGDSAAKTDQAFARVPSASGFPSCSSSGSHPWMGAADEDTPTSDGPPEWSSWPGAAAKQDTHDGPKIRKSVPTLPLPSAPISMAEVAAAYKMAASAHAARGVGGTASVPSSGTP